MGGRLACISALRDWGVFAAEAPGPHVHLPHNHSRERSPRHPRVRLTAANRDGVKLHWRPLLRPGDATHRVGLVDALRQALLCQPAPLAIASIDSALFRRMLHPEDMDVLFAGPAAVRALRPLVDGRSESGQESVLRCAFDSAGLSFEIQVSIAGVGRVDFLVEGRLVVEADSRLAHSSWEQELRDRDRDLALARLGIPTLRPHYRVIMSDPTSVVAAVVAVLARLR